MSDLDRLVGDMHVRHSLPPFMSIGLFRKKFKDGRGLRHKYFFRKKTFEIYTFITLSLENKVSPLEIAYIFGKPFRNSKTETPRPMENLHDFFLITPGKPISFLIDSGISACYFFNTPWNSMPSTCLVWIFSGIRQ